MKPLQVQFAGIQHWPHRPSFELWTILEPIPGHCRFSTLSRQTIEAKGYYLVNAEDQ